MGLCQSSIPKGPRWFWSFFVRTIQVWGQLSRTCRLVTRILGACQTLAPTPISFCSKALTERKRFQTMCLGVFHRGSNLGYKFGKFADESQTRIFRVDGYGWGKFHHGVLTPLWPQTVDGHESKSWEHHCTTLIV